VSEKMAKVTTMRVLEGEEGARDASGGGGGGGSRDFQPQIAFIMLPFFTSVF
jgi:hypothetical protein